MTTSAPPRVLQVGPLLPALEQALHRTYPVLRLPTAQAESFVQEHGHDITAAVTSATVGVDAALMAALPELKAVVNFGVGYDTTDVAAARARGIAVSNTPDVLTDCVADLAVGLLIDVFRGISAADRFVRGGGWDSGKFPLTTRVSGKRVGILGLGRIGQAIAKRLEGFDIAISYHSRSPVPGAPYTYVDSVHELARRNDALIVAASGGPDTAGLVSHQVLEALGPNGYLVNIARGSLIDQDALVGALTSGAIAGAGLDVFTDEPSVPEPLTSLDNVVLLPHMASGTQETRQAMADLVLENLDTFLRTGELVTPVP
ncbi:hydroxyacid dehydrogenase [Kocuria dechangensis]|uniref:Hydroxyacid dehydrogenase n=1 Tax=Kocuria dechangensis TaxID=1176249 RepID=A0A917LY56_9MICC|nr:2-hydroxyacid dehydrogenase [Kocuria dechangensis]GGG64780.1 hydroxyacid dehydrogenase [Kocuria dechangensis]